MAQSSCSLVCFAISYIALADLARIAGLGPEAYLWPVKIDGTIVVCAVAVVGLSGNRTAWSLLAASALMSIATNGIHAGLMDRRRGRAHSPGVPATRHAPDRAAGSHAGRRRTSGNPSELPEVADTRTRALELIDKGGLSFRAIARQLGTNDRAVRRWRDARESTPIA
ncbi:hypothetical protein CH305_19395 [Rhodococcus sp. 15-649-2-2]|uniref:DUF2637 domain-containing protein n=1 Tax=Rhodococcus sp. 15-649-2-2 TaxID=2023140 RepID=UPI000B9C7510|nr:DUF2637 domain-containing protein [Rhodococcus sp. 15-649-2-2]OZE77370.1 hypothetical protein CH305_19395 [Rhodococcus sp. 15-649-2-2]